MDFHIKLEQHKTSTIAPLKDDSEGKSPPKHEIHFGYVYYLEWEMARSTDLHWFMSSY